MKKDLAPSVLLYIFSVLVISIYLWALHIIGNYFWPYEAGGSLLKDQHHQIRGSALLAQNISQPQFFHGRQAWDNGELLYNECDLTLYHEVFKTKYNHYLSKTKGAQDIISIAPSASGLDPYISVYDAKLQATTVAIARQQPLKTILEIIQQTKLPAAPPFFQLEIVNVNLLNARLENLLPSTLYPSD